MSRLNSNSLSITPSASSSSSSAGKPDRLYVGNLSPTVDEYTLLQVFSKHGKITKLDFMFHKTGVLKGKPRGFAFIEFGNKDDALKAMVKLHDRLLRGRKLVVTYASSAPPSDQPPPTRRRGPADPSKATTLSLLKSQRRPQSAAAQIAAMEAKLAVMARQKPADEDYVPGQGQYRDGSASASPMPDDDLWEEDVVGDEEGERMAEEMEREMAALAGDQQKAEEEEKGKGKEKESDASLQKTASLSGAPSPAPIVLPGGASPLPPRPMTTGETAPPRADKAQTKDEAFKRGLAGLPKKPVF